MKKLLKNLTIYGLFITGLILVPSSAKTEPAALLIPAIENSQNQIPEGLIVRLPSFLPQTNITIYPTVEIGRFNGGSYEINLSSQPNCSANFCWMGLIGSYKVSSEGGNTFYSMGEELGSSVPLKQGISGLFYTTETMSGGLQNHIVWKQDGTVFYVGGRAYSRQQTIDIAISMANNQSIRSSSTQSTNSYTRCSTNPNNYCLRRGDRGQLVRELISNLTCLGYYSGVNDGIFGARTETGIRNFQRHHSLTVDGIAGPQTRNLLSQQCSRNSNTQTQSLPRTVLETAIKNALGNYEDNSGNTEYFSSEIDLNQDGRKEVIVFVGSVGTPICGAWECPVFIFRAGNNSYNLIGKTGAMSYGAQIAVLESKSNGYFDIATLVYNSTLRNPLWKLHKFNGNTYQNTYQDVQPRSNQIVLTVDRDQGITLSP